LTIDPGERTGGRTWQNPFSSPSRADPEWKKVKADSEINGALAKHIDSYFMDPTSFSALK
jgi:hypothetical protein